MLKTARSAEKCPNVLKSVKMQGWENLWLLKVFFILLTNYSRPTISTPNKCFAAFLLGELHKTCY